VNKQQYEFLKNEFGMTEDQVKTIGIDAWQKTREDCFMIEAEEAYKVQDNDEDISSRGRIAASIADIKHRQIKK
jgi:6-phosphogluconate dehydrogenase